MSAAIELRPRPVLLAALLLLGGLGWLAQAQNVPIISPRDAALFEGQGPVLVAGIATAVRPTLDGATTLVLVVRSDGLDVRAPGPLNVTQGEWVEAQGRVIRQSGRLTLWLAAAEDLRVAAGPQPREPSWQQLAADPQHWHGQRLRIEGIVERGTIGDREGHRLQVGLGPWPKEGPVQAVGVLRYAPNCLCHRLDAATVVAV